MPCLEYHDTDVMQILGFSVPARDLLCTTLASVTEPQTSRHTSALQAHRVAEHPSTSGVFNIPVWWGWLNKVAGFYSKLAKTTYTDPVLPCQCARCARIADINVVPGVLLHAQATPSSYIHKPSLPYHQS